MNMILLRIFIWLTILVSFGQLYLIGRYLLRLHIHRVTHCPWCWKDAGIASDFPPPWSSTICVYHARLLREQSRVRRLTGQLVAAPTRPAVAARPPEEVQV